MYRIKLSYMLIEGFRGNWLKKQLTPRLSHFIASLQIIIKFFKPHAP